MIRKLLRKIRGENRTLNQNEMAIYMDVIAHGECMPTRDELDYTNPSKTTEEIDAAVTGLIDGGIIRPVGAVDDGEYATVYALTKYGAEKASEACTDVQAMRDDYQRLERTDDIRKLEAIERPLTKRMNGVWGS